MLLLMSEVANKLHIETGDLFLGTCIYISVGKKKQYIFFAQKNWFLDTSKKEFDP